LQHYGGLLGTGEYFYGMVGEWDGLVVKLRLEGYQDSQRVGQGDDRSMGERGNDGMGQVDSEYAASRIKIAG